MYATNAFDDGLACPTVHDTKVSVVPPDVYVFGAAASPSGKVGGADASASWWRDRMPHTRVMGVTELSGNDLGKITGFPLVDAGKAFDGLSFKGKAPDIGVAER